ncbi:MAG: sporulation protein YtxC [Clostridia bacterium]
MWEYAINLNSDNSESAKYIFNNLKDCSKEFNGVVTTYESEGNITILVGCEDFEKIHLQFVINELLTEVISVFFKEKFLNKYLSLPIKNEVNLAALKKALVSFDKETDVHIIKKYLKLDENIFLESFFDFKLRTLRNKWLELVNLANENSSYLACNETFVELLKFLVDNLEISYELINVLIKKDEIKICDGKFEKIAIFNTSCSGDDALFITNIISLCPKSIIVYCDSNIDNSSLSLMCQIFDNRIKILPYELCISKNS